MRQNTPDRQEYVLNTALRLFLRHGFKKTSMDDIARAAGMTRQGLYFHYPSKDALARRAYFSSWRGELKTMWSAQRRTSSNSSSR